MFRVACNFWSRRKQFLKPLYILLKVTFLGHPEVSFGGCVGAWSLGEAGAEVGPGRKENRQESLCWARLSSIRFPVDCEGGRGGPLQSPPPQTTAPITWDHVLIVKAKGTMKCLSVALDQAEASRSPAFLTYHKEAKCPQLIWEVHWNEHFLRSS